MATKSLVDRLIRIKTHFLLSVFLVITAGTFILAFVPWTTFAGGRFSYLSTIPFLDFFFGFFQIIVAIFVVDSFLRHESDLKFQSMLFSKEIVRSSLNEDKISELMGACFWRIVRDDEFANDLVEIVHNGAVIPKRRTYNARIDISIYDLHEQEYKEEIRSEFFGARIDISFRETIKRRYFDFVVADSNEKYNSLRENENVEWKWLQPKHSLIDVTNLSHFLVRSFSINATELEPRKMREAGITRFVADDSLIGKSVEIRYSLMVLCRKVSHLIFYSFDYPTKGFEISLDYGKASIDYVNVVDGLTTPRKPTIAYFPNASDPYQSHRVNIRNTNDWVIPKSTVAFVWRLEAERVDQRSIGKSRVPN